MLAEEALPRLQAGVGDDAEPGRLEALAVESQTPAARRDALRHLSGAEHTLGQLSRYLAGRGYAPRVLEAILAWAGEKGFADDRRYATVFLDSHSGRSPLGTGRIRRELLKRGVSGEDADAALRGRDDAGLFETLVETIRRRYGRLPRDAAFRRGAGYLARRGFARDLSFRVLAKALDEEDGGSG